MDMDDDAEEAEAFDPKVLIFSIISKPLMEKFDRSGRTSDERPSFKVIIDLNFKYRGGLDGAKAETLALMKQVGISDNDINDYKTKYSAQYIFATLRQWQIEALAEAVFGAEQEAVGRARTILDTMPNEFADRPVFMIWPDFNLTAHIMRSTATVKADAARRSFSADGNGIVWAVIDSGVDGKHLHFKRHGTLDLNSLETPLEHMDFTAEDPQDGQSALTDAFGHGTHVAGIIGGGYVQDEATGLGEENPFTGPADVLRTRQTPTGASQYRHHEIRSVKGIAPRCKVVSYKVLNHEGRGEVSNILAALAHIRRMNEQGRWLRIHGVNLSVGYGFNPEWFACGQSPLCVEVNRLVKSGVVVVVSAGNTGYGKRRTTMKGTVRSGMLMTINDPGNAEQAITVGSTHRDMPHVFGTSYFSSKGPTGDGRRKPDLLAPGERIISAGAGTEALARIPASLADRIDPHRLYVDQTGTSMAAPHVSGAIAAFLSIRREFIGQPERVKDIFTATATDLGREPYMQGAGLLDLMRAIQSV